MPGCVPVLCQGTLLVPSQFAAPSGPRYLRNPWFPTLSTCFFFPSYKWIPQNARCSFSLKWTHQDGVGWHSGGLFAHPTTPNTVSALSTVHLFYSILHIPPSYYSRSPVTDLLQEAPKLTISQEPHNAHPLFLFSCWEVGAGFQRCCTIWLFSSRKCGKTINLFVSQAMA